MLVAIYARKSKITNSGDSIDQQIKSCKDYLALHKPSDEPLEFCIYEDEGFSGKNINRPGFQRFLEDTKSKPFKIFICYRLDRMSRSVLDFTTSYNFLETKGIQFISVSEQFDTSTPMGFAMLHITIIFAQLERQAIAARVRDNMLSLAHSGRWLGGIPPTGFYSTPINYLDHNFNKKKMYQLSPNQPDLEKIKFIFDKFLELRSLCGLESYLSTQGIKSLNDAFYCPSTLKHILTNPVYAIADESIYHYFTSIHAIVCNDITDFDGTHGIMPFNKSNQQGSRHIRTDYAEWIIAIAKHQGIIPSNDWIQVQRLLNQTKYTSYRSSNQQKLGTLTSLIKCSCCGSSMRVKKGRLSKRTGLPSYSYICHLKEISNQTRCKTPNLTGNDTDTLVTDYIFKLLHHDLDLDNMFLSELSKFFNSTSSTILAPPLLSLEKKEQELQKSISNIMHNFESLSADQTHLQKFFMEKLANLSNELNSVSEQISSLKSTLETSTKSSENILALTSILHSFKQSFEQADIETKRTCLKLLLHHIDWNGDSLHIYFNTSSPE